MEFGRLVLRLHEIKCELPPLIKGGSAGCTRTSCASQEQKNLRSSPASAASMTFGSFSRQHWSRTGLSIGVEVPLTMWRALVKKMRVA